MKFFSSAGCPFRRELFEDHATVRQCDGRELDIQVVADTLKHRLRVVQTSSKDDIL